MLCPGRDLGCSRTVRNRYADMKGQYTVCFGGECCHCGWKVKTVLGLG